MNFVQSMHQHAINLKIRDDMKLEEKTFRAIYAPAYQQYEKQDIVKLEEKMACTSCFSCIYAPACHQYKNQG
jgi:hypothetical protein